MDTQTELERQLQQMHRDTMILLSICAVALYLVLTVTADNIYLAISSTVTACLLVVVGIMHWLIRVQALKLVRLQHGGRDAEN